MDATARWSLLLRPDSVVVTSCLVRRDAAGYTLTVPRSLGDDAFVRLRRFHFRVDCTLSVGDCDVGPYSSVADLVDAGWPGENEFRAQLHPFSFGAHFVAQTVSFTKGCYTGQELVGRLEARGASVPWRLVRAQGPSRDRIHEVLCSKGPAGPRGVTSAVPRDGATSALGIAHRSLIDSEYLAAFGDVTIEEIT